jgi:DNA polymerase I
VKALLVDGMYLVERSKRAESAIAGPVQTCFFFLSSLSSLGSRFRDLQLFVLWDGPNEWRKERCPAYKAHRRLPPGADTDAVAWIKRALPAFGVTQIASALEADDVAATLLGTQMCENEETLLYTSDKDWLQLVSDARHVMTLTPDDRSGAYTLNLTDENQVKRSWGVKPDKLVLLRSLLGDVSDGLAGVPKVPRRLLTQLCQDARTADEVIALAWKAAGPGWTQARQRLVWQAEESIRCNFEIMQLQSSVALTHVIAKKDRKMGEAKLAEIGADTKVKQVCDGFYGDGFGNGPLFG